jgi:osmotically inducible lipoprotein OsmB
MKSIRTLMLLFVMATTGLAGCATATGAAVGGYAGHELGKGSRAATVGGAVAGGIIGHEIAR